jgi:2-polyprenyl-6-methoxyphenol hydroxylase-like FAD-dependent oxidoreductase
VARYRAGRICLAGDAGAFVPPFTASGVFKGMNNALHLGAGLAAHGDVDESLERWSARETAAGARLSALGRRLEDAFIWTVPDFGRSSASEMEAWWRDAAKLPEELFPPGGE